MTWEAIYTDPWTYVCGYLLVTIFLAPPTVRLITKNWKFDDWSYRGKGKLSSLDRMELEGRYAGAFSMILSGPVIVVLYWVGYWLICKVFFWGLCGSFVKQIAETGLPDAVKFSTYSEEE